MIVFFLSTYLFAETTNHSIDVQAFKLSHSFDTILLEEALNPYSEYAKRGSFLIGVGGHYSNNLLSIFNKSDSKTDATIVKDIIGLDLHLGYLFLKKRVYLGVASSFSKITLDSVPMNFSGSKTGWSISDPKILAKIRLTPQESNVAVAFIPYLQINAGKPEYYSTDNSLSGGMKIALDYYQNRFFINTNIGYQYSPEAFLPEEFYVNQNKTVSETNIKHRMFGGFGFGYFLTQHFSLHSEAYGFISFPIEIEYFSIDWILYGRLKVRNLGFFLGASFKGIQDYRATINETPSKRVNWRVFAALRWFLASQQEIVEAPKVVETPRVEAPPVVEIPQAVPTVSEIKSPNKLLGEIFFATNKSFISDEEQAKLVKIANAIKKYYQGRKIYVEGNTDSRGSSAHHGRLSFERAKSAESFLKSLGIVNEIIVRANPIPKLLIKEDLVTGKGLSQNRSVEIYVEN